MRLNLTEDMQKLLKEVLDRSLEVAVVADDEELMGENHRMQKIIGQSSYRKYNQEDIETIWMLADVGIRTCNFLIESATTPEQFEQTEEVKRIYVDIKNLVEYTLASKKRTIKSYMTH